MPQVPVYDNQRVTPNALPGVRQSAPSTEVFMGPARNLQLLAKGADAAFDIGEARAVAEATHAVTGTADSLDTLSNNFRQRQGIAAKGVAEEFAAAWDKTVQEGGANLDPFARRAYESMLAKRRAGVLATMRDHEVTETRRAAHDGTVSLIANSTDNMAANWTRPDLIETNLRQINTSVDALAQLNGWDPETVTAQRGRYVTMAHKRTIEAMVDANPAYARAYYDQHKDQIDGADRVGIEKALAVGGARVAAQQFADEVTSKGLSETEALKLARERFGDEGEVLAVAEVKIRFNEQQEAQKRSEEAVVNQAWALHLQGKPIPNTLMAKLPGRAQAALLAELDRKTETNWTTYGALMAMPPEQLARVNLADHFGELADAERKELIKRQAAFKNGTEDEKLDAVTFQQQLASVHKDLALDKDQIGRFNKAAADAVFQAQIAKGRKLDQAERQQAIDRLLIEGTVARPWWLDTTKRTYEVQGTPEAAAFTPKVPDEDRAKIEAALQRAGVPVTDAAVVQLYRRAKGL